MYTSSQKICNKLYDMSQAASLSLQQVIDKSVSRPCDDLPGHGALEIARVIIGITNYYWMKFALFMICDLWHEHVRGGLVSFQIWDGV